MAPRDADVGAAVDVLRWQHRDERHPRALGEETREGAAEEAARHDAVVWVAGGEVREGDDVWQRMTFGPHRGDLSLSKGRMTGCASHDERAAPSSACGTFSPARRGRRACKSLPARAIGRACKSLPARAIGRACKSLP